MANVNADYASIKSAADSIRGYAASINTSLNNVYTEFDALYPSHFYGKSYMDSAKLYTNYLEGLNEALKFFVKELPTSLEQWSNNLKAADNSENAVSAQEDSPVLLDDVNHGEETTNPVFHNAEVANYITNLESHISDINNEIASIKEAVGSIIYGDEDDISAENISKVNKYSDTIKEAVDKIKSNLVAELEAHGTNFENYKNASQV